MRWAASAVVILSLTVEVSAEGLISGRPVIVDGDTIHIGAITVRLHGIDAPEADQVCATPTGGTWPNGAEATRMLQLLIGSQSVSCQPLKLDRHHRTVARCFVGALDIEAQMVRRGLAWAFVKYSTQYVADEEIARAARLGIWQAPTEPAWDFRREPQWAEYDKAAPPGCLIKGNVNHHGERIFHIPSDLDYGKVKMDLTKGKVWFCSTDDAVKAGWRPAM
jgi:endonuclease YncB( thermonuclease family)